MPASDDRSLLNEAVREAGALALRFYGKAPEHWIKPDDNTPVSEADFAVNDMLRAELIGARSDYGWLSEETIDDPSRFSKARVWVVDPVDGTRAFLRGEPHWTISVALVEEGRPIASAVFNPALDEFYEAGRSGAARLNGKPIEVTSKTSLEGSSLIAYPSIFKRDGWPKPWPQLTTGMRNSMAYRLCLVAAGQFDGLVSLSAKSDWDLAAADLIVARAGGVITNGAGDIFRYNGARLRHQPIIAGGNKVHDALQGYLA